ncbi:hypothetical protein [Myxococcus sp. AS-1-15]|jgi:hypothetical protein|uniref:hypothetical protein n=1 Tax=Myxococcus TaxID=32 RepID=UPI001CC1A050|nr:hypothetical protein [Myxococcus sp. AS-1-15]MBZ4398119.1 hypothetical protein [Myxococcus sp. AS-1-15]BDT35037.1 hypothetical protein MFMH1_47060 [Myxococcus sp. MH1]
MKALMIPLVTSCVVVGGCRENKVEGDTSGPGAPEVEKRLEVPPNGKVVMHRVFDDKFMEMAAMPLPDNWIVNNGKAVISGPGNVNVYMVPTKTFMFSGDPMMQQVAARSGQPMRRFESIDQVIQQDLVPIARKEGAKLVKQYDAPDIAASDKGFSDLLYKVAPMRQLFLAKVTEWTDKRGEPYMMVVHLSATDLGNMVSWNYYTHALDAPKERYEESKKVVLQALAGTRYNPQYVQAYNQGEMARERASWAAHHQRMQANKAAFEAQQRAFHEKNDAINRSIAETYASRDAASDRMHHRFVNYIKDEETVRNTATGTRHQVQTGANQYWMNGNGQYVPSNDPNYDPNRDPHLNHQQWDEAEVED